jgi:hypothetical protein
MSDYPEHGRDALALLKLCSGGEDEAFGMTRADVEACWPEAAARGLDDIDREHLLGLAAKYEAHTEAVRAILDHCDLREVAEALAYWLHEALQPDSERRAVFQSPEAFDASVRQEIAEFEAAS